MDSVVIFRNAMLPRSETFILAQARALRSFKPVLAGVHPSGEPTLVRTSEVTFLTRRERRFGELRSRWYWKTGWAPGFHRRLRAARPRLIHAHFALDGAAALPLRKALRIPLVVTLHGYDVSRTNQALSAKPEGRLYLQKREDLWRQAAIFICVSEFIRQQALLKGFPAEKLFVLPIGIDLELFKPLREARDHAIILFVGRLVEKKGCLDLLHALKLMAQDGCSVQAVFVGDGPLRAQLMLESEALNLACNFVGMQPPEVVRDYMGRARVFCAPSLTATDGDSEGLGIVFAEAQAMETPVVSYRHGGVPEIVEHGKTGLLVPERDIVGLSRALRLYLEDDALWRQHGLAGAERIRRIFSLAHQTPKLEDVYREAIREQIPVLAEKV